MMESTFDFKTFDNDYIYRISSNTILYIKRINDSVAMLYFTDEFSNNKNIPDGLEVYTYDYQNTNNIVLLKPIKESYALCWTDNYIVELNKNIIINIKNQRTWNIIS